MLEVCKHLRESMQSFVSLFLKTLRRDDSRLLVITLKVICFPFFGRFSKHNEAYSVLNCSKLSYFMVTTSTFVSPFYKVVFNSPAVVVRLNQSFNVLSKHFPYSIQSIFTQGMMDVRWMSRWMSSSYVTASFFY